MNQANIALIGMEFYAFHGYYEFERRVGSRFTLDVEVSIDKFQDPTDRIEKTVNYEDIYQISAHFMAKKYKLLESVAFDIASEIKLRFEQVIRVKVKLSKINPKLPGKVGAARVELEL